MHNACKLIFTAGDAKLMNQSGPKPLNRRWMTSFRKEKKLDDYLLVGEPLLQWMAQKGEWRKLSVRCTAIECLAMFKHAKGKRKLHVVIRGKGGEFNNFTESLGELLFLTDRTASNDFAGLAFPESMRLMIISQAQSMPGNWTKLGKFFNCTHVFFVNEHAPHNVEELSWSAVLKQKI